MERAKSLTQRMMLMAAAGAVALGCDSNRAETSGPRKIYQLDPTACANFLIPDWSLHKQMEFYCDSDRKIRVLVKGEPNSPISVEIKSANSPKVESGMSIPSGQTASVQNPFKENCVLEVKNTDQKPSVSEVCFGDQPGDNTGNYPGL